jgi:hypothetical protein
MTRVRGPEERVFAGRRSRRVWESTQLGCPWRRVGSEVEVALMLSEFLYYLVGILAMVGGILLLLLLLLLLERLVAGPHPTFGLRIRACAAPSTWIGSAGSSTGPERPTCWAATDAQPFRFCRTSNTTTGALGRSANSSSRSPASWFDRNFRPVSDRARARLGSVLVAMREDEPLPPIEVWAWHGEYYVLDGHHRVATDGPASPPATTRIGLSHRPGTNTASRRTPVPLRRRRAGRRRPIRW